MWGERKKVVFLQRRVGRVVDRGGLENRWPSRVRGFESLTLRNPSIKGVKHGFTPFWLEGHSVTACCRKNGLIIKTKTCYAGLWLMDCRDARGSEGICNPSLVLYYTGQCHDAQGKGEMWDSGELLCDIDIGGGQTEWVPVQPLWPTFSSKKESGNAPKTLSDWIFLMEILYAIILQ